MSELNDFQKWCVEHKKIVDHGVSGGDVEFLNNGTWCLKAGGGLNFATRYRIKPRTIKVNGFDVPAPMTEKPKEGDTIFAASCTTDDLHVELSWFTAKKTQQWLSRGICHTTKESAIAHAKAMLGIDPNGGEE